MTWRCENMAPRNLMHEFDASDTEDESTDTGHGKSPCCPCEIKRPMHPCMEDDDDDDDDDEVDEDDSCEDDDEYEDDIEEQSNVFGRIDLTKSPLLQPFSTPARKPVNQMGNRPDSPQWRSLYRSPTLRPPANTMGHLPSTEQLCKTPRTSTPNIPKSPGDSLYVQISNVSSIKKDASRNRECKPTPTARKNTQGLPADCICCTCCEDSSPSPPNTNGCPKQSNKLNCDQSEYEEASVIIAPSVDENVISKFEAEMDKYLKIVEDSEMAQTIKTVKSFHLSRRNSFERNTC